MNITPLYELKDRLRAASIAGTSLLSEDFRLKKAAESFKTLEGASPVFKKIGELTASLLSENSERSGDKAGTLLDTVTLVDSVICTLGAAEVSGDISDIEITEQPSTFLNIPYSQLSELISALTTSGSGNFNKFVEIKEDRPELFRDYRIKPLLVTGLGAAYSELADKVEDAVLGVGKEMIPLLKKGFDPKGKKEMLRRVFLIDRLGGAGENAFYLEQLETAEKDVRRALIHALRHDEGNIDRLVGMTKTEKGKAKDAAYKALAGSNDERAAAALRVLAKKNPEKALDHMRDVTGEWQSELAAELITKMLVNDDGRPISISEALAPNKKSNYGLREQLYVLKGKTGSAIEELYRSIKPGFEKDLRICSSLLGYTIIATNDESMKKLALKLNADPKMKDAFVYSEMLARLIDGNIDTKWFEERAKKAVPDTRYQFIGHITDPFLRAVADPFIKAINDIQLIDGEYVLCEGEYDEIYGSMVSTCSRPITKETVHALTDVLIKYPSFQCDTIMRNWADKTDPEYCRKLAEMFVDHAVDWGSEYSVLLTFVKDTGVKNIKGAAVRYCKNHPKIDGVSLRCLFNYLQGDPDYKLAEARELYDLLGKGKIKWDPVPGDLNSFIEWVETNKFR